MKEYAEATILKCCKKNKFKDHENPFWKCTSLGVTYRVVRSQKLFYFFFKVSHLEFLFMCFSFWIPCEAKRKRRKKKERKTRRSSEKCVNALFKALLNFSSFFLSFHQTRNVVKEMTFCLAF